MNPKEDRFQGELFGEFIGKPKKTHARKRFIPKIETSRLIISYENMVLLLTGLFVAVILSFSLGVERGKRLALLPLKEDSKPKAKAAIRVMPLPPEQKEAAVSLPQPQPVPEAKQEPLPLPEKIAAPLKPYTIQVATFEKNELAQKEMQWLRDKGYYAFIIPSNDFLQICVGEYTTKEQASPSMIELKKRYKDCFLRKRLR